MRALIARSGGAFAIVAVLAAASVLMGEQPQSAPHERIPMVEDWTSHHVVYSAPRSLIENLQIEQQPRYFQQYLRRNVAFRGPVRPPIFDPISILRRNAHQLQRDWGVVLAANATQPAGTFPAKVTWNADASPSCANDVVVYTTGLVGTGATTVDIFGLNQLYVNTGGTGYCAGTTPTVLWSYHADVTAAAGPKSSVVVSFAGDQLAWIEGGSGGAAILHVLRPGTGGQGTLATPINMSTLPAGQYTASGATYNTCKGTLANACELHLAFANGTDDTVSSPYYDGVLDAIFVGDTGGNLHEFTNVFKGTPAEAGGNWPIGIQTTGAPAGRVLGSPVYDETSGNVFVGTGGGNFKAAILVTGTCGSGTIPCVGNQTYVVGTGITEAPIVDSTTEEVFVFGDSLGGGGAGVLVGEANANVVGANQPLQTQKAVVNVGTGTTNHLYAGDFDNDYYTSDTSLATASGFLYVCGNNGAADHAEVQRITITAGLLGTVNVTNYVATSASSVCSPVTLFYNAAASTEYMFFSVAGSASDTVPCGGANGCILAMTVTGGTFTTTPIAGLAESGGTSGIIIDNDQTTAVSPLYVGTASVYFTPLSNASATYPCDGTITAVGCAVKATQANLN